MRIKTDLIFVISSNYIVSLLFVKLLDSFLSFSLSLSFFFLYIIYAYITSVESCRKKRTNCLIILIFRTLVTSEIGSYQKQRTYKIKLQIILHCQIRPISYITLSRLLRLIILIVTNVYFTKVVSML